MRSSSVRQGVTVSGLFTISDNFLNATAPLTAKDAAAAIILNEEHHVLLQLRDDKEGIFFPHHWGCFGGAIEPGEETGQSLLRELNEELGIAFDLASLEKFITISFTFKANSTRAFDRYFFVVKTTTEAMRQVRLGEGHSFEFFSWQRVMGLANVTPYDKFALWLYFNQHRFTE